MAPNQRKAPQRRAPKPGWLLGCFGFPLKSSPSEGKKARKSSARKRWFKLCLSKIRVVNVIRRKKASLDAKKVALKATQSIMLEASKVQQRKLHSQHQHHHALGAQDQLRLLRQEKEIIEFDSKVKKEQLDDATRYNEEGRKSKAKHACTPNVSKDSLIGMSIMLTTLVIMGIWGKLCAILCMCAWFYCVPLLRVARDFNHNHVPRENDRRLHLASKLRKVAIGDP